MSEFATVEIMCAAREVRRLRQEGLLKRFPGTLISFSMNIAGPNKRPLFSHAAMDAGEDALFAELCGAKLLYWEECSGTAGHERFYCLAEDAAHIKRITSAIEDAHPLGRLFDLDVLDTNGRKLSREEFGMPPRKCLLCGNEASLCARSRRHPVEELQRETNRILSEYFSKKAALWLAEQADAALRFEIFVTPKPGLVDRNNNGSHRDMTYAHFERSIDALVPYWAKFVRTGWAHEGTPEELLPKLRPLGMAAEQEMMRSTGGVNTHKGAIFSLGILLSAAGYLMAKDRDFSEEEMLSLAGGIAQPSLSALSALSTPNTHGEALYLASGNTGARGEAAEGFPHAAKAKALLKQWQEHGLGDNDAGALTLLALISQMEDTNMISRVGQETAKLLRQEAACLLEKTPQQALVGLPALDDRFILQNASPGGCADMLAAGWLLKCIFE